MLLMILDTRTALEGGRQGLDLCLRTVLPTLFPFIFLSTLITGASFPLPPRILRLIHLPEGSGAILLCALIGGYPVGAQSVSLAYTEGLLDRSTSQRLLPICNQCSPAFLFGICSSLFTQPWKCWILWTVQIISALITAMLLPGGNAPIRRSIRHDGATITSALHRSLRTMASVCGWIILFRISICFLERWCLWLFSPVLQASIIGSLELTNGCTMLRSIENEDLRFLLCSFLTGMGGLCITMQSLSVISPELDRSSYFLGKVIQSSISVSICSMVVGHWRLCAVALSALLTYCLVRSIKSKKTVAFPRLNVYNGRKRDHVRITPCFLEKR